MEAVIVPIAVALSKVIVPMVMASLTGALGQAFVWLRGKANNDAARAALDFLDDKVRSVVRDLEQTMAQTLKALGPDGKLSPGDAARVKAEALRKLSAYYSAPGQMEILAAALRVPKNQVLDLMATKIEATLQVIKVEATAAQAASGVLPAFGGMTATELAAAKH